MYAIRLRRRTVGFYSMRISFRSFVGTKIHEIPKDHPALDRGKVELAPLYVQAFPRCGSADSRPWAKRRPVGIRSLVKLTNRCKTLPSA
jgi:hypothetical protein